MQGQEGVYKNRWLIVIVAGLIMGLALGIRHVQGLFMQPVVTSQAWTREAFGFALAMQNLVWGLAQPFTGMIADRFGSARVLFAGLLVYALGLLLMAGSASPVQFTLTNGVIIGIALSGTAFGAVFGALSRIFDGGHRDWALAVAGAIGGLGQFCMVPFVQALLGQLSWQTTAVALCIVMLLLAPLAVFLRERPTSPQHSAPRQSIPAALREAFAHKGFWLLNLGFIACGFQLAFIAAHLPAYLLEQGLTASQAGMTLAIIALANIFGIYAWGRLGGWWRPKYLLSGIYACRVAAIVGFLLLPVTPLSAYLFSAAMGFLWLGTVPLTNGVVAGIFGTRYITTLFGFVFLGHQVGGFFGVWLGGYVYDRYNSYDLLWFGSIAIGLVAALLHWPINDRPVSRHAVVAQPS